ncbi:MAG: hypothetical protein JWL97_3743 [Gemmatimonadales bacterium]|nr:hypothetical protein [Gemmatimonadales bacterium]
MNRRAATIVKAALLVMVGVLFAGGTVRAAADPSPQVLLPAQAPYVEAPQQQPGTPVDPAPSPGFRSS